ncbi:MAG TPA: glutathione S-transferase family protein [Paracoccaceae bacterium]|nr:glutathione S-transferase family protein [Paracoccaceae bacterium]
MTYVLAIGDRTYSSWSLRGWLMFAAFGLPVTVRSARLYTADFAALLEEFAPARRVPAAKIDGAPVWDSLAILETLAERHPKAGHWPEPPDLRALARSMVAEMHSGFTALRSACPMNLRQAFRGFEPSAEVRADLDRIEALWALAREASGDGPWLFGRYSAADAYFAPVASRIATYGLAVGPGAAAYVGAHLAEPNFRRWRAMGLAENYVQPDYDPGLPVAPWPGPAALPARAVSGVRAENTHCPYSGKPVATDSFAEIQGRVIGFCNPFCRDKTVADPEAWPEAMALLA